jgi:hypothetical protein
MNNPKKLTFIFISLILFAKQSIAGGCDPCVQAAVQASSTTIVAALNGTAVAAQVNVTATKALTQAISASSSAITTILTNSSSQTLSGMSASTNKIELAILQNTKTIERMGDHTTKTIVDAIKKILVAEEIEENNRTFGKGIAHPMSGDIGANRAALLKEGVVQGEQMWSEMSKNMNDWNNNAVNDVVAGSNFGTELFIAEPDSVWSPVPFISKRQITSEESLNAQKLLTLLVNPTPTRAKTQEELSTDRSAVKAELNRKLKNAKFGIVHAVMAKTLVDKTPTIPMSINDWQMGYTIAEPDAISGKVSMSNFLESETSGRLSSAGWYQDIKTKTEAGLLREQLFQQAITNKLYLSLLEKERHELILTALITLEDLKDNRPKKNK